ncbi:MAG: hypothetical protein AAF630_15010 [Cyanobacteria bacterium P01_C01_bin.38]
MQEALLNHLQASAAIIPEASESDKNPSSAEEEGRRGISNYSHTNGFDIILLFNLLPTHPDCFTKQLYDLNNLHDYSASDNFGDTSYLKYSYGDANTVQLRNLYSFKGIFHCIGQQYYRL